nr:hypothetical protein [Acinetobacter tjernbergiae]
MASPRAMSAVVPLQGWSVTKSTVMGASTLIDAIKDTKVSAALVTPNAKQVAEVLRGGAAGIALNIAVDQLIGAVDWVMDPANNQIVYKKEPVPLPINAFCITYRTDTFCSFDHKTTASWFAQAFMAYNNSRLSATEIQYGRSIVSAAVTDQTDVKINNGKRESRFYVVFTTAKGNTSKSGAYAVYAPIDLPEVENQNLALEVIAEQVISNADAGSLDAQVATNIAAQNILNDMVQAEPVVQELENNARDKDPRCKAIIGEMERLATDVEFRYNDLLLDRHDLYRNYRSIKNAHWSYSSWDGHIIQYNKVQGTLKSLVTQAVIEGCTVSTYVRKWSEQKPPAQPLPKE